MQRDRESTQNGYSIRHPASVSAQMHPSGWYPDLLGLRILWFFPTVMVKAHAHPDVVTVALQDQEGVSLTGRDNSGRLLYPCLKINSIYIAAAVFGSRLLCALYVRFVPSFSACIKKDFVPITVHWPQEKNGREDKSSETHTNKWRIGEVLNRSIHFCPTSVISNISKATGQLWPSVLPPHASGSWTGSSLVNLMDCWRKLYQTDVLQSYGPVYRPDFGTTCSSVALFLTEFRVTATLGRGGGMYHGGHRLPSPWADEAAL